MTASAMIIGMIPMALGLGEGAEQNAPLGRAVIGGLLFATVSTLFFVPTIFAGVHRRHGAAQTCRRARRPSLTGRIDMPADKQSRPSSARDLWLIGVVTLLGVGAVVIFVLRAFQASALAEATVIHAKQYVTTTTPTSGRRCRIAADAARHPARGQ